MSTTTTLSRLAGLASQCLPSINNDSSTTNHPDKAPKNFNFDRARGFAYYLLKKEYKRVGILSTNTPAFLEAIFGIGAAGAINIAVNYRLKTHDVSFIFDHSDADLILVDAEYLPLLDHFRGTKPHIPILVDSDTDVDTGPYDHAVLEGLRYDGELGSRGWSSLFAQTLDEFAVNALAYTSGTTSRPKGVEYTHRGCYLAALANVTEFSLAGVKRCKYLWTLPMFHAAGWTFPWAVTAVRGTHYCLRKMDYPDIWRLLREEGITHFCAAPTVNTMLVNNSEATKLQKAVQVLMAASPPTASLLEKMTDLNLQPTHVYGMTETYGPTTKSYPVPAWDRLPKQDRYSKMARQGHGFLTSLPCRVVRTDDDSQGTVIEVERNGNEIGEVVFEGNTCARGYYKTPEATKHLFQGGVLHSGDLAEWHPDGAIQVLDRSKDIIISGGENISSVALESIIATHPQVIECAVVAVRDEQWGERPKVYLIIHKDSNVTGECLVQWAKDHPKISRLMVPREVEIVAELPKTSTGKIKKNILRRWSEGAERALE